VWTSNTILHTTSLPIFTSQQSEICSHFSLSPCTADPVPTVLIIYPYSVVFVIRMYNLFTYRLSACSATIISNMFNLSCHIISASVSFLLIESPLVEDARHDGCTPLFVSPVPQSMYTQSGNCHLLAYIPSWWKIGPAWLGWGVARPPLFTLSTIKYKVVGYVPAERADTLPKFLLYSVACPVREKGGQDGCAGISKQSMGARNRVGIGLSYWPARLHRLAELIPWNQFRTP
jgi:hypothetical protein